MTKGELRKLIQEVLSEELGSTVLQESVEGPSYVIKAWDTPESKEGIPTFDSSKQNIKYPEFDDVIKALQTSELSGLGAYEITWVKTGTSSEYK